MPRAILRPREGKRLFRIILTILACVVIALPAASEQTSKPTSCAIGEFFHGIVGEWVGVCKQSTDSKSADDKYFHIVITDTGSGHYTAKFEYYRVNDDGTLARIGTSNFTATISSDRQATTRIIGNGELLVDNKAKKQEHDLTESLTSINSETVEARGSGSLKVLGMPLGLGKLGKVRDDQSTWSLSGGTLSIHQSLSIVFRALCFSKGFKVDADYSAVRGSDISSQIPKQTPALTKSGG